MADYCLKIETLTKEFKIGGVLFGSKILAVDNINILLPGNKPQIMSIVGESGSGKTTVARMILNLLEPTSGEIFINGTPLSHYSKRRWKKEFYKKVQPIFQNPFTTFSMRKTVDSYLFETAINLCGAKNRRDARIMIQEVFNSVGLEIDEVLGKYPNQFSGGELQRISIARALLAKPNLIVADEPVAMIDASLRMNIVNLFKKLKDNYKINFIYITHDLSTAYYVSDYIGTMYRGSLIEFGKARDILSNPAHPYTQLLLDSIPKIEDKWNDNMILPDLETKEYGLNGCRFAPRCSYAQSICCESMPDMVNMGNEHLVLCYKYNKFTESML